MSKLFFHGRHGFGDCIYQRPLLQELSKQYEEIYLETSFPWLYHDMDLKFVVDNIKLHTNKDSVSRISNSIWTSLPLGAVELRNTYTAQTVIMRGGIMQAMAHRAQVSLFPKLRLPARKEWADQAEKVLKKEHIREPFILVRPVTDRAEWPCPSRNPQVGILEKALWYLKREVGSCVQVLEVDSFQDGTRIIERPKADVSLVHGEVDLQTTLGLVQLSLCCLGPPGWVIPACYSLGATLLCICGGFLPGKYMLPVQSGSVVFCEPSPFCVCGNRTHICQKNIPDERIVESVQRIAKRLP